MLVASASACRRGDPEGCTQALSVTRDALKSEQFDLARQWRDRAWKLCEDRGSTQTLDTEVVAKQKEVTDRAAAALRRKQESEKLIELLGSWAGQHRENPARAAAGTTCEEPADKTKPKDRWCAGQRALVGSREVLSVRYWDEDPKAVRFSSPAPEAVGCAVFGAHRVIGSWQVPTTTAGKSVARQHCELTAGVLNGMHALVSAAANADVFLFSPEYLEKDSGFRRLILR